MSENYIKANWYYFCSLANQLQSTQQFVDHSLGIDGEMVNANTFSNEFAKILLLAASEFEVISKALCKASDVFLPWNASIVRITRETTKLYPKIGLTEVFTPYQTIKPLAKWAVIQKIKQNGDAQDVVEGISWWKGHNNIKHERISYFTDATLNNCVQAMASLMVLELYLSKKVIGNVDLISSIGCQYFNCNYTLNPFVVKADSELPDFA